MKDLLVNYSEESSIGLLFVTEVYAYSFSLPKEMTISVYISHFFRL